MNPIDSIVIAGGGAAGWMAAAALATARPGRPLTLVESPEIGIIGVGEASFPSIRAFNRLLGIDEVDFLRATGGTFKLGIRFDDWLQPGHHYFHTFGDLGTLDGPMALWAQYLRLRHRLPVGLALTDLSLPGAMARGGQFLPPQPGAGLAGRYDHAYHFDAQRYASYLQALAISRGVQHVQGRIAGVQQAADGQVQALRLDDGRALHASLFIDCTGFASRLLGQAMAVPFLDQSHLLPVDRAWAVPAARNDGPLTPYTTATAMEAGWTWRIPLQERTGHGHVFSSRHIDEQRALAQLLARLDGPPLAEPRLLRFTTGYRERLWERNVVAIGLAGGFLEPLESTAIFLVQSGIGHLVSLLDHPQREPARAGYNTLMRRQYERIRDFIVLHYRLSRRRDSRLWQEMAAMDLPDTLAHKIDAWRAAGVLAVYDQEGFDANSWLAIHAGMEHWPQRALPWPAEVPEDIAAELLLQRRHEVEALLARMPMHEALLAQAMAHKSSQGRPKTT
ncbi:tryptophan halogenase family protein [Ideonella alba]|uniref:Tryptophan 7-halogenase n=1 Tax=Ideonella alba TaxID=2824118 RepID=A0A940Y9L7_9BURK|nr:tryptophan halogenase family protein [Ideonella alba]MBQ0928901.1 tryptophan 7-halogenase [Ideonella alba]